MEGREVAGRRVEVGEDEADEAPKNVCSGSLGYHGFQHVHWPDTLGHCMQSTELAKALLDYCIVLVSVQVNDVTIGIQ